MKKEEAESKVMENRKQTDDCMRIGLGFITVTA